MDDYPSKAYCDPYDLAVLEIPATSKAMRMCIRPGVEVCSDSTHQAGKVIEIIRSHRGIPVCVKVLNESYGYDYIEMSNITLYEPYDYDSLYTADDVREFAGWDLSWDEYLKIVSEEGECPSGGCLVGGAV